MKEAEIQSIKQRFGIIGNADLLNYAIRVAAQVAPTDMSVLITGESGTGKESFSKIIHSLSIRKHNQFIAINCGAIPEGTMYSELFGHEKGAFTGAVETRKGFFEAVDKGTIFLDEVGELNEAAQAMLLRVLENGEFIKMGSNNVQKTDVRVIAATNVNMRKAVEDNLFREDLYFRLNTVPIYVPSLHERDRDVILLFRKFSADFSERYRTKPLKLTPDAEEFLLKYHFKGNIRQLKNLVEQMSVLETERIIDENKLKHYLPESTRQVPALLNNFQKEEEKFSDREILYKVLFDMRNDVAELKKLVLQLMQTGNVSSDFINEHKDLFGDVMEDDFFESFQSNPKLLAPTNQNIDKYTKENIIEISENEEENAQNISHKEENDSLSLEEQEKELILKALKKNNNKRKYAAQDLGISERTLYRKIKHYEIEL